MNAHSLLDLLVRPHASIPTIEGRLEARFIATLYVLCIPLSAAVLLAQTSLRPEFLWAAIAMSPGFLAMFVGYGLARSEHYRAGTWLTLAVATAMTGVAIVGDPGNPTPYAYLLIPSLLAAAMLSTRASILTALFNLVVAVGLIALDLDQLGVGRSTTLFAMLLVTLTIVQIGAAHRDAVESTRRRELEARDRRQSALLEAGFGGMAFVTEQGQVVECSRGFAAIFGFTPDLVIGQPLDRFLVPTSGQSADREAIHRDGHIFPVEVVRLPYDELGMQRSAVAIRDLTEHRRLQTQLHQADRMATMGQLAAGVAHEINNPLAWVLGNLHLLAEQLTGSQRQVALRAEEGARRVDRIVRDLKTFSRTREPEPQAVDLRRAVGSAVNMIRHQLRDRGLLIEDYADVPTVDGDETRIGQVCLNLLVNAVEALPQGQRDRNQIKVRLYTDASGEAVIEVADNGSGIAPEVRHRMFEPFFTTKARGTGLGLSITRSITASLGGRLLVESQQGVGTTMRVYLPPGLLAEDPEVTLGDVGLPVPMPPTNRAENTPRVLVVDDEPDILELIEAALSHCQVVTATSADDALTRLAEGGFDAILCDLMMPGKTGMELHDEAIRRWPALAGRFAFVTGGAYTPAARTFLDQTRAPVLNKPFSLLKLRALVDDLLEPA